MKNLPIKNFKKKTNKRYSFNNLSGVSSTETTVGDPTNTVITILTTVSGQTHLTNRHTAVKFRV
ncbi:hypothetical protein [Mucilaginibacter sp. 10I4]|uniref:hypothetical protein n=1 Tax=Mucilaginibacter sp. 10I4 TaxID=3048580 RepID=UPI002B2278E0|nr:hypothetical protein [Mucilaginibacter sp. 10I4]MEB0261810.1 hypothetical protein [Mucilaginibacter sp. 10I4]